jgi:hypothetical protein
MHRSMHDEGWQYKILDEIIDHHKDNTAVLISDGMVHSANGKLKPKVTMYGHYHLCAFKDSLRDWVMLKELKESNPI